LYDKCQIYLRLGGGLTPRHDDGVKHGNDGEGDEPIDEAFHDSSIANPQYGQNL
jgi:hypothetical protein